VAALAVLVFAVAWADGAVPRTPYHAPPVQPRSVLFGNGLSPRACSSWLGDVLVGVCDPTLIKGGFASKAFNAKSNLRATVSGRAVHGGGNRAIAQFVPTDGHGEALVPGNVVTLTGTATRGSVLFVRVRDITKHLYVTGDAMLWPLGLQHGGTVRLTFSVSRAGIRYRLRRPDGTVVGAKLHAGYAGPGVADAVPAVPRSFVASPGVAAATYVAAADARDGKTLCGMFTKAVARRYRQGMTPCWATVAGFIDFTGENNPRSFEDEQLTAVGPLRHHGPYVGVPLTLAVHFTPTQYMPRTGGPPLFERVHDVVWLLRVSGAWRVAKPSLALMAAAYIVRGNPLGPP